MAGHGVSWRRLLQALDVRSLTVSVRYEIDACAGVIRTRLSGAVTLADMFGYYSALASDSALRPNFSVLADCRDVTGVPTFAELSMVATAEPRIAREVRPTRAAVVVSSAWLFGIARQFAALAEPNGIRVVPFYNAGEAERWLAAEA